MDEEGNFIIYMNDKMKKEVDKATLELLPQFGFLSSNKMKSVMKKFSNNMNEEERIEKIRDIMKRVEEDLSSKDDSSWEILSESLILAIEKFINNKNKRLNNGRGNSLSNN